MLHIKVSSRGSGKNIDLSQFLSNDKNQWQACVFHLNEPVADADAWLVLEDLDDDETPCRVNPRAEAPVSLEPDEAALVQLAPFGFFTRKSHERSVLDRIRHRFWNLR